MRTNTLATSLFALLAACGGGGGDPAPPPVTVTVSTPAPPSSPATSSPAAEARITEFHYQNVGDDEGEFIEVRVVTGADVTNIRVDLYDGETGTIYATLRLSSVEPSTNAGFDYYVFELEQDGLQNGAPDGFALIDGEIVVEFLSYDGVFEALEGLASGMTSIDIEVVQSDSTPVGSSLQVLDDGTWVASLGSNTLGTVNVTVAPAEQTPSQQSPPPPPQEGEDEDPTPPPEGEEGDDPPPPPEDPDPTPPEAPEGNRAPMIAIVPLPTSVDELQSFIVDASGSSDPDGDDLTFEISLSGSDNARVSNPDGGPIWTVETDQVTEDEFSTVTVAVSDAENSVEASFDVTISNYDRTPLSTLWGPETDSITVDGDGVRLLADTDNDRIVLDLETVVADGTETRFQRFQVDLEPTFQTSVTDSIPHVVSGIQKAFVKYLTINSRRNLILFTPSTGSVSIAIVDNSTPDVGEQVSIRSVGELFVPNACAQKGVLLGTPSSLVASKVMPEVTS